jgi:hypothetical protein
VVVLLLLVDVACVVHQRIFSFDAALDTCCDCDLLCDVSATLVSITVLFELSFESIYVTDTRSNEIQQLELQ